MTITTGFQRFIISKFTKKMLNKIAPERTTPQPRVHFTISRTPARISRPLMMLR